MTNWAKACHKKDKTLTIISSYILATYIVSIASRGAGYGGDGGGGGEGGGGGGGGGGQPVEQEFALPLRLLPAHLAVPHLLLQRLVLLLGHPVGLPLHPLGGGDVSHGSVGLRHRPPPPLLAGDHRARGHVAHSVGEDGRGRRGAGDVEQLRLSGRIAGG